ncbi:hypothetical protein CEP51_011664 [Fusarium floridanum]|uniref:Heterokaryon incompatibility domain-containing protein n=1 Tax=Fusarium floridanum TaxID=1325733 RepID=A0A428R981_9HYPO|nr:hypothetical protein CEP51_011664 [Fusarium floridanum]
MSSRSWHQVSIEGSYFDEYGTAGFLDYLKRRGVDMFRYKVIASRKDYAYFSRDTLENHREEYEQEMDRLSRLAAERQLQRDAQELKSRLLREPTPVVEKVLHKLETAQDVPPESPKTKAVDFDLLELLLPGYRSKDSKGFNRPAEAPMYEPLPGPDWFRLLVLEPWRADNDRLRCHLRAVRLDDVANKYSALSYCWTQSVHSKVQSLVCNGLAIDVSENLRLALENTRYSTLPRILWVDALCINQDDLVERNHQVQLMGQIYQQANETIVWLGDVFPRGPTRPEFDAICKVVKEWDESLRPYYNSRNMKGKLCRYEPEVSQDQSRWFVPMAFDASLVSTLFGSPWFERRWVIQEVALARSAVVKVPGATIQWKWIGLAAGIIRTNHDRLINAYRMPNLYNAYLISRLSTHGPLPPLDLSLLTLLRLTTGFKTSEKLDVVYALLGFLNRQGESSSSRSSSETVRVDYTLSESELGILVAESHMAQTRRPLSFLSDAAGISDKPTWSPRWTHKMASMLDPWPLNDDTNAFNPAKGLSFKRFHSTDPNQLKVEGVQISQVAWQTATFGPHEDFGSIMTDLIRMLHRCHGGWDIWNASIMPAVARSFCGGRDKYGGRAKDSDHFTTQFFDIIRTWSRCHPNAFPELSQAIDFGWRSLGGLEMTWADAAETSSFWLALARCTIHIIPALVSIGLVILNCRGYFIGNELEGPMNQDDMKLGLLQVAAKVQELLIVASVGSVIFHIIRSELVFGEGIPLGLLTSGWNFSQIQYFWSPEFLGCLNWDRAMSSKQQCKRVGTLLFIAISGLLALVAGPAAAVLMIPRQKDWPVGGGIYWLNGSSEQLWPTNLTADYYSEANCTHQDVQFVDNRCPSAGFLPLYHYYEHWWNHLNAGFSFELRDFNMRKIIYSQPALRHASNTWSYTAHSATATLQDAVRGLHRSALQYLLNHDPHRMPYPSHLEWADPIIFKVDTKIPLVRVKCRPQGMVWLWGTNLTVETASIRDSDPLWEAQMKNPGKDMPEPIPIEIDVLRYIQEDLAARGILDNSSSLLKGEMFQEGRRTLIFPVETWQVAGNSLDLVILLGQNWERTNDEEKPHSNVLTCSIDARWSSGATKMQMRSHNQLSHEFHLGRVRNLVETEAKHLERIGYLHRTPPSDGSWPEIRLSADWYNILSPVLPNEPSHGLPWIPPIGSKQTTLEVLFNKIFDTQNDAPSAFENVIATAMADGLSRCGLIPNYNGSRFLEAWPFTQWGIKDEDQARSLVHKGEPRESFQPTMLQPENRTRMVMKATYGGYVMEASSWFDYLSMAALLTHALIAMVHTVLLICYQTTSGAWDTILELVALTQQSEPPPKTLLANTSAGVRSFKTVKLLATVETSDGRATGVAEDDLHPIGDLQMRVREPGTKRNPRLRPKRSGQLYGQPGLVGA